MPDMRWRDLPPDEWHKVTHIPPFDRGLPDATSGHWRILVVEDGEAIVGCVSLHTQVHFDPWWVAPDRRTNPGIVRELLKGGVEMLRSLGIDHVFATIADDHQLTQSVAEHAGFVKAPGSLFLVETEKLGEI